MPKKSKPIFDDDIECPWCSKAAHVTIVRNTIVPAQPAEVELKVSVEKSEQKKLGQEM